MLDIFELIKNLIRIIFAFTKNSILPRINQDWFYFSHVYEMCITLSSSFRDLTYDYYLKQPLPMREVRLNQMLAKNPRHICLLNRFPSIPYTRKWTKQEIIFVNGRNSEILS